MAVAYDKYYQDENLFGNAYPELLDFFSRFQTKGKLLDVCCGQGRDAIPLSQMGFEVTGIDNSTVGITQMLTSAEKLNIGIVGEVADIYTFDRFGDFDFILFDSMFHFLKKDRLKELALVQNTASSIKTGGVLVFCIQDTGSKVKTLIDGLSEVNFTKLMTDIAFKYRWINEDTKHYSTTY